MTQVAHRIFPDIDATMEHATDFRELYRGRVRLLEPTERGYLVFHDSQGQCVGIIVVASGKINPQREEQWWPSEDAVISWTNKPVRWQYPEAEPEAWRGIFSLAYRRRTLFSESVEIQTAKLPRL